jgi:hypothetical protein
MGALMSGVTSCLRGSAVDKFGGALCVNGGGEHCSIVSGQDFQ